MRKRAEPSSNRPQDKPGGDLFAEAHRIRAFLVGIVRWANPDLFPGFPGRARADVRLARFLEKRGVTGNRLCFLKDENATTERIQNELRSLLSESESGETLIFYYAGHGAITPDNRPFFASYDTGRDLEAGGWFMESALKDIKSYFKGDQVILLTDCCHSGAIGELARAQRGDSAYASLSSAGPEEESSGNWTFTESLLLALNGSPVVPTNSKGEITFQEIAQFAAEDMALFEEQRAHYVFGDTFNVPAVVSLGSDRKDTKQGERVEVLWESSWFKARILAHKDNLAKVHYVGFPQSQDEWVPQDRIRAIESTVFPERIEVEAEWNGQWWKAEIMDTRGPLHYVRFLERSRVWDEWIAGSRLRLPQHN